MVSLLFKLENFQNLNLAEFDIYGKSWQIIGSKPSLVELCRYCMYDEINAKKLIDTFENNSTEQEFREFNNKFRGKTSSDILRLYWADQKNNEHSTERISAYHSPRRRLVSMSQSVKLRPYQIECVEQLVENYDQRRSSLLLLPTGAGKTKTALHALRRITDNNSGPTNILWLVHSTPLCQQAAHAIEKTWIENRSNSKHKQIWLNILFGGVGLNSTRIFLMACPRLPFRPQTLLKQTKQILNNSMIFLTSLFVMRPTTELKNKREFLHSGQRHTESASQQRLNSTRTHVFSTNFTLLCASRRTTLEGAQKQNPNLLRTVFFLIMILKNVI